MPETLSHTHLQKDRHNHNRVFSLVYLSLLGLIVWHTVLWHNNGTHERMLAWAGTPKVYLLILYNLALMLLAGSLLGLLMGQISRLFSRLAAHK